MQTESSNIICHLIGARTWRRRAKSLKLRIARMRRTRTIPIDAIRCEVSPFATLQGFGGRPINFFPPHGFYELYLRDCSEAFNVFYSWYDMWFNVRKAWKLPMAKGGWQNGSLMKTVNRVHAEYGVNMSGWDMHMADPELIKKAIHLRIAYYFSLLESIEKIGLVPGLDDPIKGIFESDLCYLNGGHHRVASLAVLGYQTVEVLDIS